MLTAEHSRFSLCPSTHCHIAVLLRAAGRAAAGGRRSPLLCLSLQLPVPGGAAVVPGEVREADFTVGAGGLRGVGQQRAPPAPAVPLPRGQRGRCGHRGGGAHQVRAAGVRALRHPAPGAFFWGCEAGSAVLTGLVPQAGGWAVCTSSVVAQCRAQHYLEC